MREIKQEDIENYLSNKTFGELAKIGEDFEKEQPFLYERLQKNEEALGIVYILHGITKEDEK